MRRNEDKEKLLLKKQYLSLVTASSVNFNFIKNTKVKRNISQTGLIKQQPNINRRKRLITRFAYLGRLTNPNFSANYKHLFTVNPHIFERRKGTCNKTAEIA